MRHSQHLTESAPWTPALPLAGAVPARGIALPRFDLGRALRRLRMRHFELLAALGSEDTLRGAARHMALTQSAVSKMLREAEDSFGAPLFVRARTGLRPTPIGQVVIARANTMMNDLTAAGEDVSSMARGLGASLRIGVASPLPRVSLAITRLRHARPGVVLRIRTGLSSELIAALLRAELDCVIGTLSAAVLGSPDAEQLLSHLIAPEHLCVVCAPAHALVGSPPLCWTQIAGQAWVLPSHGSQIRQAVGDACGRAGCMPPQPVIETMTPVLVMAALELDSALLGALPGELVAPALAAGRLCRLPLREEVALSPLLLIARRQRSTLDGVIAALRAELLHGLDASASPPSTTQEITLP